MSLRIPTNQITYKFTPGGEYVFANRYEYYQGYYYEVGGKTFAGKEFALNNQEIKKAPKPKSDPPQSVLDDIINNPNSGESLSTYFTLTSLKDFNKIKEKDIVYLPMDGNGRSKSEFNSTGEDMYFVKKINSNSIGNIDEETYNSLKSHPLYTVVAIKSNYSNLEEAEKTMPGITSYIFGNPISTNPILPVTSPLSVDVTPPVVTPPEPAYYLKMTFNGIPQYPGTLSGALPLIYLVNDIYNVNDWNTLFYSPAIPFTSVNVNIIGGQYIITLYGGENITITPPQFYYGGTYPSNIISIEGNSVTNIDPDSFNLSILTSVNLPNVIGIGNSAFRESYYLTSINLPACSDLGGSNSDDQVFSGTIGNTISATFNNVLATNNLGGSPDGDIQYLTSNNTVTITYV